MYLGLGEEVAYNGIYQINHLGEVSVVGVTGDMEMGDGKFYTVNEYHGILVAGYRDKDNNYKLAQLHDGYSDYSDFTVDSEYITSYFGDTSVTKELRSFTLSFTKTNLTDFGEEEANVYYRTIDPSNIDSHDDEVAS
ncbi:MAG: hypothetical protein U9R08_00950 [Nanoarchaeota archaeon]|nr:hypothetical protein [Nanoarchaeota archaeon]